MDALDKAVKGAGGVTALAFSLGVSQSAVSNWRKRRRVPAEHVLSIERTTGVSRHELCPDVFGAAPCGNATALAEPVARAPITKAALRARLCLSSDGHLAKVLKLPAAEVEAWPEDDRVPALPQVLQLLGVQEQPPPVASAPEDPDADRIDLGIHAA